jgi:hypothetical protein
LETFPSLGDYNGQFVHPRLAVGGCPHPENVPVFVEAGIRGIIDARSCMLKEHVIYICSLPDSIFWKILGTWDGVYPNEEWTARAEGRGFSGPTTVCPVYAEFMVEQMALVVRDHSPVLIHCAGGIGRSGNLAAVAYAALEDTTVADALERMRRYRPVLADWGRTRWKDTDPRDLVQVARAIIEGDAQ